MSWVRILRNRLFRLSFHVWQRLGFHVVPNHFYYPVPDTSRLSETLWRGAGSLPGVDLHEDSQQELLGRVLTYREEYEDIPRGLTDDPRKFHLDNGMFTSVDAEILYAFIRMFRPRKMLEVGGGFSTLLSAQALQMNQNENPNEELSLVTVDPYADAAKHAGLPDLARLTVRPVQELELSFFEALQENDMLFIDSSHVLKLGSDVQYLFNEVIPRVKKGVLIHFHDIFLPAEYPRAWIKKELRFYNEQYLLQAFLSFNSAFRVIWAGSYMHLSHPRTLEAAFSSYDASHTWPGSLWIQRTL